MEKETGRDREWGQRRGWERVEGEEGRRKEWDKKKLDKQSNPTQKYQINACDNKRIRKRFRSLVNALMFKA